MRINIQLIFHSDDLGAAIFAINDIQNVVKVIYKRTQTEIWLFKNSFKSNHMQKDSVASFFANCMNQMVTVAKIYYINSTYTDAVCE